MNTQNNEQNVSGEKKKRAVLGTQASQSCTTDFPESVGVKFAIEAARVF